MTIAGTISGISSIIGKGFKGAQDDVSEQIGAGATEFSDQNVSRFGGLFGDKLLTDRLNVAGASGLNNAVNLNQPVTGGVPIDGSATTAGSRESISNFLNQQSPILTTRAADSASGQAAMLQEGALREAFPAVTEGFDQARGEIGAGFDDATRALAPFLQAGQQAAGQVDLLLDPQAQFDYLQSNPLFQAALDNANMQTQSSAAARGRLAAGDTLEALSQNTLLAAQPLLAQQQSNIQNLLGLGAGVAGQQAGMAFDRGGALAGLSTGEADRMVDLLTQIGNTRASGLVGYQNMLNADADRRAETTGAVIGGIAKLFSDMRLKKNVVKTGKFNGYNTYKWEWNDLAKEELGLEGEDAGVLAQEVFIKNPEAIGESRGFMTVDYGVLA